MQPDVNLMPGGHIGKPALRKNSMQPDVNPMPGGHIGKPALWIRGRQRPDLESTVGVEASDLLFRSRRYYYVGLLLMLVDLVACCVALGVGHPLPPVVIGVFAVWMVGGTVTVRGYVIAKRGSRSASAFISQRLGYPVRIGDVGPPTNWHRQINRAMSAHEEQTVKG
ncbi:MAG: hypothetical protein WAO09_10755 [Candidatus Dormiibacterota bacterium]